MNRESEKVEMLRRERGKFERQEQNLKSLKERRGGKNKRMKGKQESWTGGKGVSLSHWPGFSEVTLQTADTGCTELGIDTHDSEERESACVKVLKESPIHSACTNRG